MDQGKPRLRRYEFHAGDDSTFAEDTLRVFRAAQFAARFEFAVAEETIILCRSMNLRSLAGERVFGELEKALLKAPRPSIFFEVLRKMGQLHLWFPEVEALIGVPQEPKYHPEGDVWNHTMLVLDQAAQLRCQAKEPLAFMLGALCHDFGKVQTTALENGVIRSLKHETEGIPSVKRFLSRLTSEAKLHKYVQNMVKMHMRPQGMFRQKAGRTAMNHMFDASICPEDLLLLDKANRMGRALAADYTGAENFLREHLAYYHDLMSRPAVKGADLVEEGFLPGKDFGEALALAHKMHLAGVSKEEALRQAAGSLRKAREPKDGPFAVVSMAFQDRPELQAVTLEMHVSQAKKRFGALKNNKEAVFWKETASLLFSVISL